MPSSGVIRPQHIVYYPLLAYNSYKPDNRELIVTILARKKKISQVMNLGQDWQFVTFVQSPCMFGQIDHDDDATNGSGEGIISSYS